MNTLVKFKFTLQNKQYWGWKCRNVKLGNSCGVRVTPICWAGSVSNPRCSNLAQTKFKCVPESATKFKCQLLQTGEGGCGGEGSCHQTSVRHKFESATCIMFEIQTLNVHLQLMFGELCNNWKMMDDFVLTFVDTCFVWTKNQSANITMQFIICVHIGILDSIFQINHPQKLELPFDYLD